MVVLIKIAQLILALSLLILVHELGHFLFARLFHIRVDKFYLFFDPWFSLVKFKPKNSHTEYGIGWLPLGGYCKISGMIDESMDREQMAQPPQPWEFRSKPAWQRFFVMVGGVLFNLLLAFALYSCILFTWGEEYVRTADLPYGVQCTPLAQEIGFQNGDIPWALDDQEIAGDPFVTFTAQLVRTRPTFISVKRGDHITRFTFNQDLVPRILEDHGLFSIRIPFVVDAVPDSSHNAGAGLRHGDRFLALNGQPATIFQDIQERLLTYKGTTVTATLLRGADTLQLPLQVNASGLIGVVVDGDLTHVVPVTKKDYSFFASIGAGVGKAWHGAGDYLKELGLIFSPKTKAYKSVGSFIAIGNVFPGSWNWYAFWNITALLSIMLAVLNVLPIPALDGGHILFVLVEMITGRKPGDKFLEYAQMVGMILLIGLMILAFGNDIVRFIIK